MNQLDTQLLERLGACEDAREWCKTQPSLRRAYEACDKPGWLLWLAQQAEVDREAFVLIGLDYAKWAVFHASGSNQNRFQKVVDALTYWLSMGPESLAPDAVRDACAAAEPKGREMFSKRDDTIRRVIILAASLTRCADPHLEHNLDICAIRAAEVLDSVGGSPSATDGRLAATVRQHIPWVRIESWAASNALSIELDGQA